MLEGRVHCVDSEGNEQSTKGTKVSLCRCGGSAKKPLCDGTHRKNDFKAPYVEITWFDEA
jgi:CDGSH-type Zn-finger protein